MVVAAILICPRYQYDTIDLFGKTAQRKNVLEQLKEVGKIQRQDSDEDLLTTKICRKCFLKLSMN